LGKNKHIDKQISGLQKAAETETDIERRLDELVNLLASADIDSTKVKQYQEKFNKAVERTALKAFEQLDNESLTREDLLNRLGKLLVENPVDSKVAHTFAKRSTAKRVIIGITGLAMITLGMAMIIMPAPPYFEMFTVFYFSNDDGVTLMDLISLIIVLCGVYLLVMSIIKYKRGI
jgi:hypothetical protein